jgi:hypothetical protein
VIVLPSSRFTVTFCAVAASTSNPTLIAKSTQVRVIGLASGLEEIRNRAKKCSPQGQIGGGSFVAGHFVLCINFCDAIESRRTIFR